MSRHPETSEIFFIRHAPVVKKSGHVPPADPPIQDLDYRLERVAAMLPQGADWHVSPLLRAHQTAALLTPLLAPKSMTESANLAEMDLGTWAERPVAEVWEEIERGPLHNWSGHRERHRSNQLMRRVGKADRTWSSNLSLIHI